MSNVYFTAMSERLELAKANDCSKSNETKLIKLCNMLASDMLSKLLADANIDAKRFTRAIYACEKVTKFASQAVNRNDKELNANTYAIFRTAINCYKNDEVLTQAMIESSISKDKLTDDSVKHLVFQRDCIQAEKTVAAQSQTSRDALVTLKILTKRADMRNAYDVNLTALASALCEAFEIESDKIEKKSETKKSTRKAKAA